MGSWAALLSSLAAPIAKRVLAAIGMGVITITGLQAAIETALNSVASNMATLPAEVAAIVAMAGFFEALSILAGGYMAGLTFVVTKKFAILGGAA